MKDFDIIKKKIGKNLRVLRKSKDLSLDKVSLLSGVSKAMLGQIERGESSPTIALLWKIANGLDISYSELMEGKAETLKSPIFSKKNPGVLKKGENILAKALFPYEQDTHCEIFHMTLTPGSCHLSPGHNKGVVEHVLVLSGSMKVLVENEWLLLKKGEGIRFNAHLPHGYKNDSNLKASFQNIIHYL